MDDDEFEALRAACPFCDYAGPSPILYEAKVIGAFVIEPLNPCTPGHVIVVSRYHVPDFADDDAFAGEVVEVAASYARSKGGDWNLITSKGEAATQTIRHLHVHLVPRVAGDGLLLPWSPRG